MRATGAVKAAYPLTESHEKLHRVLIIGFVQASPGAVKFTSCKIIDESIVGINQSRIISPIDDY